MCFECGCIRTIFLDTRVIMPGAPRGAGAPTDHVEEVGVLGVPVVGPGQQDKLAVAVQVEVPLG